MLSFTNNSIFFRRAVFASLTLFFALHLITIHLSPVFWGDETWIVEFGRLLFEPDTDWSTLLDKGNNINRYAVGVCYLGSSVHYWIYRLAGPLGPRCFEILCFCVIGLIVFLLSNKITGKCGVSALIMALILGEPYLVQAIRSARCDAFALLMQITAIYFLEYARDYYKKNSVRFWWLMCISIAFIVVSCFVWTTTWVSSLAYIAYFLLTFHGLKISFSDAKRLFGGCLLISLFFVLLLCVLYPGNFLASLAHSAQAIQEQTSEKYSFAKGIKDQLIFFTRSPLLYFSVFLLLFTRWKYRFFWFAFYVIAMCAFAHTWIYAYRIIYFFPFMTLAIIHLCKDISEIRYVVVRKYVLISIALYACLEFSYSLGRRTFLAFRDYEQRDFKKVIEAYKGTELENNSTARIYVNSDDIYYLGVIFKWKQFAFGDRKFSEYALRYDYVIWPVEQNMPSELRDTFCKVLTITPKGAVKSQYRTVGVWKNRKFIPE